MAVEFVFAAVVAAHTSAATLRHALNLRDKGFTVLPPSATGLSQSSLAQAARACECELSSRLCDVHELGIDPVEQAYTFNEIAHRLRRRWDFRNPNLAEVEHVCTAASTAASPIIRALHSLPIHPGERARLWPRRLSPRRPRTVMSGAIVSWPGADAQSFHCDSNDWHNRIASHAPSHRLFNAFVPLVDIAPDSMGTSFWPGSHLSRDGRAMWAEAVTRSGTVEEDDHAIEEAVSPGCPAGGVLLFDVRTLHRGLANTAKGARPYVYTTVGTGWASDKHNFPPHKLQRAVQCLPSAAEERELARRAISKGHPTWDEIYASEPYHEWRRKGSISTEHHAEDTETPELLGV